MSVPQFINGKPLFYDPQGPRFTRSGQCDCCTNCKCPSPGWACVNISGGSSPSCDVLRLRFTDCSFIPDGWRRVRRVWRGTCFVLSGGGSDDDFVEMECIAPVCAAPELEVTIQSLTDPQCFCSETATTTPICADAKFCCQDCPDMGDMNVSVAGLPSYLTPEPPLPAPPDCPLIPPFQTGATWLSCQLSNLNGGYSGQFAKPGAACNAGFTVQLGLPLNLASPGIYVGSTYSKRYNQFRTTANPTDVECFGDCHWHEVERTQLDFYCYSARFDVACQACERPEELAVGKCNKLLVSAKFAIQSISSGKSWNYATCQFDEFPRLIRGAGGIDSALVEPNPYCVPDNPALACFGHGCVDVLSWTSSGVRCCPTNPASMQVRLCI